MLPAWPSHRRPPAPSPGRPGRWLPLNGTGMGPVTPVTDARQRHRRPDLGARMSFEYLIDPAKGPQWKGVLPGKPVPYVLRKGEGETAMLFRDLFTVLLSGDETENQFGIITADSPAGDIIPTHSHNATHETFYVLEGKVRLFYEDGEGTKQTSLLDAGDFGFVPAGF